MTHRRLDLHLQHQQISSSRCLGIASNCSMFLRFIGTPANEDLTQPNNAHLHFSFVSITIMLWRGLPDKSTDNVVHTAFMNNHSSFQTASGDRLGWPSQAHSHCMSAALFFCGDGSPIRMVGNSYQPGRLEDRNSHTCTSATFPLFTTKYWIFNEMYH